MNPLRQLLLGLMAFAATNWAAAQAEDAKPANVPQLTDTPPRLIQSSCAPPEYPWTSIQNKETGVTKVELWVTDQGDVIRSFIGRSSGSTRLDAATQDALKRCKFEPSRNRQGTTVFGTLFFDYRWRLEDAPKDPWVALRALQGGGKPETVDFVTVPFTAASAAREEQRVRILQGVQAAARKNAGCSSVESVDPHEAAAAPLAETGAANAEMRTVRETWAIQQCGYTMRYDLLMFFPKDSAPSYWMTPMASSR